MNYSSNTTNTRTNDRPNAVAPVATVIRVLVVLEALVFAMAALLHAGVPLPVGFTEPLIVPAAIVEGLIALFLLVSAFALFVHQTWAWAAATFAHAFAVGGILLGITALALGAGPTSDANYIYHRVMLVLASAILILLLTPLGRAALGRGASRRK
jgi:hypothetical protein